MESVCPGTVRVDIFKREFYDSLAEELLRLSRSDEKTKGLLVKKKKLKKKN